MATKEADPTLGGDGSGSLDFDMLSEDMPIVGLTFTVPAAMKVTGAPVMGYASPIKYHGVDVRRPIPTAKMTAVRTALAADCRIYTICFGGNGGAYRDGRGFRATFTTSKTDAQVTTFLNAVETAITT
jgi:hypothetical protein